MDKLSTTSTTRQLEQTIDSANNLIQAQTVATYVFIGLVVLGAIAGAGKAASAKQAYGTKNSQKQQKASTAPQPTKAGIAVLIFIAVFMLAILAMVAYVIIKYI